MQPARFVLGLFFYVIHGVVISLVYHFFKVKVDPILYFGCLMVAPLWSFTFFVSYAWCLGFDLIVYLLALYLWPGGYSFSGVAVFTLLFAGVSVLYLILNYFIEICPKTLAALASLDECDQEKSAINPV